MAEGGLPVPDAHAPCASSDGHGDDHVLLGTHQLDVVADARLLISADALDDLEHARIAAEGRLRSLRDVKQLGGTPVEAQLAGLVEALAALEHGAELALKRALREHPLGSWVKRTVGIGEKQGARLIAAIGDPTWNGAEDRPRRGPAELWAYCGFRPDQRRQKGVQSNWNATAKMRTHLCAGSCIKQAHSPHRAAYDRERAKWAERDTTDLHKHNHALRVVAKEILKDLWREARAIAPPIARQGTPAPAKENPYLPDEYRQRIEAAA